MCAGVQVSNNLGIMWSAVELTDAGVCLFSWRSHNRGPRSRSRPPWKFLMLGSLGTRLRADSGPYLLFALGSRGSRRGICRARIWSQVSWRTRPSLHHSRFVSEEGRVRLDSGYGTKGGPGADAHRGSHGCLPRKAPSPAGVMMAGSACERGGAPAVTVCLRVHPDLEGGARSRLAPAVFCSRFGLLSVLPSPMPFILKSSGI
jgi:hypothetical protein